MKAIIITAGDLGSDSAPADFVLEWRALGDGEAAPPGARVAEYDAADIDELRAVIQADNDALWVQWSDDHDAGLAMHEGAIAAARERIAGRDSP